MNVLQLIQQTTAELGLNSPSLVIGSQDPQIKQFLALLNRLGTDICRQFEWQRLDKEHILTTVSYDYSATFVQGSTTVTVADTSQLTTQFGLYGNSVTPFANIVSVDSPTQITMNMPALSSGTVDTQFAQYLYNLPSDWLKQIPQTEWDRTNRWPLMGPQSAQDWQSFKSGIVYAGPRERFRILENQIAVNPLPPNGLTFAFEYISNAWVRSSTGTPQTSFTADTDTCIFSDSLMVTGLKAQWKAAKGLDGTFDLGEFRLLLEQNKAQDKSAPRLSLSPFPTDVLLTEWNLPDGNYPSS
jgi:hypothetical protein